MLVSAHLPDWSLAVWMEPRIQQPLMVPVQLPLTKEAM
jgi:hypothetical protein